MVPCARRGFQVRGMSIIILFYSPSLPLANRIYLKMCRTLDALRTYVLLFGKPT